MNSSPQNTKVRDSRAGDIFHYRWAARRCLRMAHPLSPITAIGVETSAESGLPGEYVIDLSEYEDQKNGDQLVTYSQLKHSTQRVDQPFVLSELRGTLTGFGKRFLATRQPLPSGEREKKFVFVFVSNRPVAANIKDAARDLGTGIVAHTDMHHDLAVATGLTGDDLKDFFESLVFRDAEQDYQSQKRTLRGELAECLVGFVEGDDADRIVNLVVDKVMPRDEKGGSDGMIHREDVLLRLKATTQELFPAMPAFDSPGQLLRREQHAELVELVLDDSAPLIIHAEGGVGKTVVACQIAESLPIGSEAIIYDCFGNATYRNPAQPRHRARDALLQMANELAVRGRCEPLFPRDGIEPAEFFKAFAIRLMQAVTALNEVTPGAKLVLLVDAADNAEMVAEGPPPVPCFAAALLEMVLPPGCCLVMLCRTERIRYLRPSPKVRRVPLREFSVRESSAHLRTKFPAATDNDAHEFHRLSNGNPRVQAQEMAMPDSTLTSVLSNLGPRVTTVDAQIAARLDKATAALKTTHGSAFAAQMDSICYGLANLPPLIPIQVLARAAGVTPEEIRSMAYDLGRSLYVAGNSVQFRDEPTETWFLQRFSADQARIAEYAVRLKPLAREFTYVAQALPRLLYRAGDYQQVIDLALSDAHLPVNNSLDERAVRIDRLQFAFKAALTDGKLADAMRIAFRAGEEMAGDSRQLEMFAENIDLVAALQAPHRVQELAMRHQLGRFWPGCENLYTASLLCSVPDFKGEGRGYLRSAMGWLRAVLANERKSARLQMLSAKSVQDEHLVELIWSHLALDGPKGMVDEIDDWKPRDLPFRLGRSVISRLVDAGRFQEIDEIAREGREIPFLIIALANELSRVGRLPPAGTLASTLKFLGSDDALRKELSKSELRNPMARAAISTLEACAAQGFPASEIRATLDGFVPLTADLAVRGDYGDSPRERFVRAASLRAVLAGEDEPSLKSMLPPESVNSSTKVHRTDSDKEGDYFLTALIPWYYLRAKLLVGVTGARDISLDDIRNRSNARSISITYRFEKLIELEVADAHFAALLWKTNVTTDDLKIFLAGSIYSKSFKYGLGRRLPVLRASIRTPHLANLRIPLEQSCLVELREAWEGSPQEHAKSYTSLARAVLALKPVEAATYFDEGTQVISRFGDEVLERWRAVTAVAERRAAGGSVSQELAYRFFRCSEDVGDYEDTGKYFERSDAIMMVTRLNPAAGIAGLSRWRDREVGWFGEHLIVVATELLRLGVITAKEAWGLTGFQPCRASEEFACKCFEAESEHAALDSFWARLDSDLTLEHGRGASREKLTAAAAKRGLSISMPSAEPVDGTSADLSFKVDPAQETAEAQEQAAVWASVAKEDVSTAEGFERVRSALHLVGSWHSTLPELMDRVPVGRETAFLALTLENADSRYTTFGEIIANTRRQWLSIASVAKYWPDYLRGVGRRCCFELCNGYRRIALREFNEVDDVEMDMISLGIGDGLAAWDDPLHASSFFGFIASNASRISPTEAEELLDFGLKRFERQLRPEKGDGPWCEQLHAPDSPSEALGGLVWSALGSPYVETRWQAAHCVRRWAETDCAKQITALLEWDRRATVGAFGGRAYLFYHLHARLYLLFGLHRAAVDHASLLAGYAPALATIALNGLPHVLIQRTAAQAALLMAQKKPRILGLSLRRKLERVGVATGPRRRVKHNSEPMPTPWHRRGQVDTTISYRFDMDFDDHWLNPLADVFGADREQVIELTKEVVVKDLKGSHSEDARSDARHHQWFNEDRGVSYYKSDYPRTDDQEFYFAYHSMHIVAGRLLQKMRVTKSAGQVGVRNEWEDWLRRHSLGRTDGRWLADRRDPAPVVRRAWLRGRQDENWLWSLTSGDFVDCLCAQSDHAGWLCVEGSWSDHDTQRVEKIRVSSALVRPETADSLANSLRWSEGPNHYYLPNYRQHDSDLNRAPFDLIGWIWDRNGGDPRLDSMDPFARQIHYPALRIGPTFAKMLKLTTDLEGREWRRGRQRELAALAELWSEREHRGRTQRENPSRIGNRLTASPALLRDLCKATKRHLLFSVSIDRRIDRGYGGSHSDYDVPVSHQIFILSADGWLRDPQKNYRIG